MREPQPQVAAAVPPGTLPEVTIIWVTRNRRDELRRSLESALHQTYAPRQYLLVDNASEDGTLDMVRTEYPQVRTLAAPSNLGCPAARNWAVCEATSPLVVFLDDDGWLADDAVAQLVSRLQARPTTAAVTAWIRPGAAANGDASPAACPSAGQIRYFTGCASLLRRDAYLAAGGFPTDIFAYGEEPDLSLRLLDQGYECWLEPGAIMYHQPSTINRSRYRQRYWILINAARTACRLHPWFLVPGMVGLQFIHALRFALRYGHWQLPFALFTGCCRELPGVLRTRAPVSLSTFLRYYRTRESA